MGGYNRMYKHSPHDKEEYRHLYDIWTKIKQRCRKSESDRYKDYGGRGIDVCDEWHNDFDIFVEWAMGSGYEIGLTIDRINNDGDYEPDNCRWITKRAQNRNKRTNVMVEYHGETKSLMDWCEELDLPYYTIQKRIKKGMDPIEALEKPVRKSEDSFASLCRKHGMRDGVVYDRIHKLGWDLDKALNTPVRPMT